MKNKSQSNSNRDESLYDVIQDLLSQVSPVDVANAKTVLEHEDKIAINANILQKIDVLLRLLVGISSQITDGKLADTAKEALIRVQTIRTHYATTGHISEMDMDLMNMIYKQFTLFNTKNTSDTFTAVLDALTKKGTPNE